MDKHLAMVLAAGLVLGVASAGWAQGTNRFDTGGNYSIGAPPGTNCMKWVAPTNAQNPGGDNNLVWSKSGRYLATDRLNTNNQPFINLIGFNVAGNITNLGPRSSANPASNQTVYADITDFTCNDDRIIYVNQPTNPPPNNRKRLMSCSATGAVNVVPFLATNLADITSPSIIYDAKLQKERLLFMSPSGGVWNIYTVPFNSGGVPVWTNRQALTAFSSNQSLASVKWCPELGTNYQPLLNRYVITKSNPTTNPPPPPSTRSLIVFTGVRDILDNVDQPPTNLFDPRFDARVTNASGGSQGTWTYDGNFLMCGINTNPAASNDLSGLFSAPSIGTNKMPIPFPTPPQVAPLNKKWPTISPNGMKAAFTVNNQVVLLPLQCDQNAVTNAGTTNIVTDGSYTKVEIPGAALSTNSGVTNFTFTVMEPTEVDTNNFPTNFVGNAREFGVSGVSSQFNFSTNVSMSLHFEDSDVPTNMSATNMCIYVYNPQTNGQGRTGTWSQVSSSVDTNTHYVTSSNIQHFSVYALGEKVGPPSTPTNLSATDGTYTGGVIVAWNAVANAELYTVYRNIGADTNSAAAIGWPATNAFTDTSAGHATSYYYWVTASNSLGVSAWSASNAGYRGLSAPTNLAASPGTYTDKVVVAWSAPAGAAGYIVYRSASAATNTAGAVGWPVVTTFDDTNAPLGTSSYYWVAATNALTGSGLSPSNIGYRATAGANIAILGTNLATIANGDGASADKGTDFGSLVQGSARTNILAITNGGTATLTINGVTTNGAGAARFRVTSLPATVSAGTVSNFNLVFDNAAEGVQTAMVAIANTSTSTPSYAFGVKGTTLAGPSITANPQSLTNNPGSAASFTVVATGTVPLRYQWQKNTANIGSATNATYTMAFVAAGDAGNYRCLVSNIVGAVTSAAASLTVNTPASITADPQSLTNNPGSAASFSVTASGTAPLRYQWQKNAGNIGSATNATYSIVAVAAGDAGNYRCLVSNIVGVVTSAAASLTVNSGPTITADPQSVTTNAGVSVSFAVSATGTAPLYYQWQKDGGDISGATATNYTIAAVVAGDAGNYRCLVSNIVGVVTSAAASLTVHSPPAITANPQSVTTNAGAGVSFAVGAVGTPPLTYQWQKDGGNIAGATATNYAIAAVVAGDAGNYSCLVSNVAGAVTSAAATLIVTTPSLPAPTGVTASEGTYWDKVRVTWEAVAGATNYLVYRGLTDDASAASQVGAGAATTFDDTGATNWPETNLYYWVKAANALTSSAFSASARGVCAARPATARSPLSADFDGDSRNDLALYQESSGIWSVKLSGSGYAGVADTFGGTGYLPVAKDFDGDGKSDLGIYDEAAGSWAIKLSGSGYYIAYLTGFGGEGYAPAVGDYDGDRKADPALYHAASGLWAIKLSGSGYGMAVLSGFGGAGSAALVADFDGDGKIDPGIYGETTGTWTVKLSGSGYASATVTGFGGTGYLPVAGAYDNDTRADLAIYDGAGADWTIMLSASAYITATLWDFGGEGCAPVVGDFDGDRRADPAYYQSATSTWFIRLSGSGYGLATAVQE